MPSALQPDDVVEVFVGDTLEDAMAYAVAALGPDLVVRRARKLRKSLTGKEKYEVLAGPAEVVSDDAVGNAFDALLEQAEAAETGEPDPGITRVVRRTTRPAPAPEPRPEPAQVALPPAPEPEPEPVVVQVVQPEPEPEPEPVVQVVEPEPEPAPVPAKAARKKAAPRKKPAASGWSRQRLADLGLPQQVLDLLPETDPTSDLRWAAALAEAIDQVLPLAAALSEDNPVVVDGYGLKGVVGILDAATRGLTPGSITVDGVAVPATATELALVVRKAVLS